MNKFITIFKHTYSNKIRSKSFIIITILLVISIILLSNFDKLQNYFDSNDKDIAITTDNNEIYKILKKSYVNQEMADKVTRVSLEKGKNDVKNENINYLLEINLNQGEINSKIYATKNIDSKEKNYIKSNISQLQFIMIAQKSNMNLEHINKKTIDENFNFQKLKSENNIANISESTQNLNKLIVLIIISISFYIILNYSNQIAFDVATEKTSRISELLITSVKPSIHIASKILAILSVAFTQILIMGLTIILCYFIFDLSSLLNNFDLQYGNSSTKIIIYSIIFMVLGLISYISLASLLGSITTRMENIGQSLMPITTLNMIAFYIAMFSMSNIDTLLVKITSFIPLLTPIIMPIRILSTNTPEYQIIIGLTLSLILSLYLFRIAIISYKKNILSNKKKNLIKKIGGKK
ncbi:ABC transporter permease [Staphylococcus sp. GSSP0090]|nr:ABC transporter permease [Staphylococcus sp. GSSP0090]